ncbi:hypothetical protein [Nocardioides sp. P5_C9_2]
MDATTTPATGRAAPGQSAPAVGPSAVPWSTVLPLAVLLSGADAFWTVAMRTALGSVERTDAPATSWLRESLLLLPVFALAVLGALVLARRWFGPHPRGLRAVGGTVLLVVGLGTLTGAGVLAVSSAYDYRLQAAQLPMLDMVRASCGAACQGAQLQATLGLQERAVALGTLLLLLTNLVLVGWLVALRGGHLRLASARPDRAGRFLGRFGPARTVLAGGLVGSAAIHAAVMPEHVEEWPAAGVFFAILTLAELGLAVGVLLLPRAGVLLACAAASGGPLLLWLVSRTAGMPFGPEIGVPEPVGLADVAACALEVLTLVLAVALLRGWAVGRAVGTSVDGVRLALVAVVAVTALGVAGSSISWVSVTAPGGDMHASDLVEGAP